MPLIFRKHRNLLVFGTVILVAMAGVILYSGHVYTESGYYEVFLNGKSMGYVKDPVPVQSAFARLQNPIHDGNTLDAFSHPTLKLELRHLLSPPELADPDVIEKAMKAQVVMPSSTAAVIDVDGREVVVVANKATAEKILTDIVADYQANLLKDEEGEVEEVKILQNVTVEPKKVSLDAIIGEEEAKEILLRGTTKKVTHTVAKGESLWTIASVSSMTVEDLQKANPDVKPERLQIGQELSMVVPDPYITIEGTHIVTYEKQVPPRTEIQYSSSMWPWESSVKQAGENGTQEITDRVYTENGREVKRDRLSTELVKEPVARIVVKGNRTIPPHGTGRFAWPVSGNYPITSNFGWRSRDFHTGIDIGVPLGTPVHAADSGIVTTAGWDGGYGRAIVIDHGGGKTVTVYGHLSRTAVSVGTQVERGQLIGYSGNTGNSTGPHLHFEVRIDGSPVNPIKVFQTQ